MIYRLLGLLLLVQWGINLSAQEILSGAVVSEDKIGKRTPVPFATVYWQGTNYGTTTDINGTFQLGVPKELTNLIVSYIGYKTDTLEVKDFDNPLVILLVQSNTELGEVEVVYRRKGSELSFINPIQTTIMNEKELFKAACCNLSESFETNPSVDVNFTDAITGTKQIKMLGLNGSYTMISRENMPGIRGLGNGFGLSFIPGLWVESIQVTKGVGSVVNGYESIAGQINFKLREPNKEEESVFNLYGNQEGRLETNFRYTNQLSKKLGMTLLLHGNIRPFENDVNNDGFRDFPLQEQINVLNRWKFTSNKGWVGQVGLHYVNDDKEGGQTANEAREALPYRIDIASQSLELFGKTGYLFPEYKYKSFGFQWSIKRHSQESSFGARIFDVTQNSGYANFIYQSIIGTSDHQFKTGASFVYDEFEEQFERRNFDRIERVPGAFFEYTYQPNELITLVAGLRGDYHNIYGGFISPRLHARYAINETTVVRALAGSGQRSPTALIDNQSLMASSRTFLIAPNNANQLYGLDMERAWNVGLNLTHSFVLDYREGTIQFDFYNTTFKNQVIVDRDLTPNAVLFYNLSGKSRSNTALLQVDYELLNFLDLRVAYRWVDVRTENSIGFKQQPFTPVHRFFINWGYETATSSDDKNWLFDLTVQWFGEQRIPTTEVNSLENRREESSTSFALVNGQITRNFSRRFAVYVGVENLFNFQQTNPIVASDNPFGNEFDASLVWGPVFGRNIYGGLRWKILKTEE